MAQTVRFATLEKFKAGELRLLVCSDVAARGLDIGGLSHVFNFDVPHHAEDYVHRIGRTGRAGLEGHAFTIAIAGGPAGGGGDRETDRPRRSRRIDRRGPRSGRLGRGRRPQAAPRPQAGPRAARRRQGEEREPKAAEAREPKPAEPRARKPASRAPAGTGAPSRRRRDEARHRGAPPLRRHVPRRAAAPRAEARRASPRAGAPRGHASEAPMRGERRQPRAATGPRRGRRPAVRGFGDDVPAFMLVRVRPPRPVPQRGARRARHERRPGRARKSHLRPVPMGRRAAARRSSSPRTNAPSATPRTPIARTSCSRAC